MTEHARLVLQNGYSVVMMDSRAHGASDGTMATYGWLERQDASAVIDALESSEHPNTFSPLEFRWERELPCRLQEQTPGSKPWWRKHHFREFAGGCVRLRRIAALAAAGQNAFRSGAWTLIFRGEDWQVFRGAKFTPEKSAAARAFRCC